MEGPTLVECPGKRAPEWFMGVCTEPWSLPQLPCPCQVQGWMPQVPQAPCICISAGLLCKEGGHDGPSAYTSEFLGSCPEARGCTLETSIKGFTGVPSGVEERLFLGIRAFRGWRSVCGCFSGPVGGPRCPHKILGQLLEEPSAREERVPQRGPSELPGPSTAGGFIPPCSLWQL